MRDFEAEARQAKVERITAFLREVHAVLPPRLPLLEWVTQDAFPFDAMRRASGAKTPCSPTSKAMVLEELAS